MITNTPKQPEKNNEKLCVKELAASLSVSVKFVYQMRARGFQMTGIKRNNRLASTNSAVAWIVKSNFRLVHGIGVVGEPNHP